MEAGVVKSTIEIVWERETNEASYHLAGLTHAEAQRVLMAILQDNLEQALAEAGERSARVHNHQ